MRTCQACGDTEAQAQDKGHGFNVINGNACCGHCDGEFCFRCGAYPVELVGDDSVCIPCDKELHPYES